MIQGGTPLEVLAVADLILGEGVIAAVVAVVIVEGRARGLATLFHNQTLFRNQFFFPYVRFFVNFSFALFILLCSKSPKGKSSQHSPARSSRSVSRSRSRSKSRSRSLPGYGIFISVYYLIGFFTQCHNLL